MTLSALTSIAIRRLHLLTTYKNVSVNERQKVAFKFELGTIGFRVKNIEAFTAITCFEFKGLISELTKLRGGDVKYVPLFRNFPDELPNDESYLMKRIFGFYGYNLFDFSKFGADPITQFQSEDLWLEAAKIQDQKLSDSKVAWIDLEICDYEIIKTKLISWVESLLYSQTSIKEELWTDIFVVLNELKFKPNFSRISFKETLTRLTVDFWKKYSKIEAKTPTDFLRILAAACNQDVSLSRPISFKGLKFSRSQRKEIVSFLNSCSNLREDLLRYKGLWISLSKWIHPGDFAKLYPNVFKAFDDLRNDKIKSFEAQALNSLRDEKLKVYSSRPGVFLRRISLLLKEFDGKEIAEFVNKISPKSITLPLLLTVHASLQYDEGRLVVNKKGKSYTVKERNEINDPKEVLIAVENLILQKLKGTKDWKSIWIDPLLLNYVLPFQSRKQSDGLLNLARGSRVSVNSDILRLFIYWKENNSRTDLDLSCLKLNNNFNYCGRVSWSDYGDGREICHSGDVQSAPLGASEFIDINISLCQKNKIAYLLPSILKFSGENFEELSSCYAGWMERNENGSKNKQFDPATVVEKINVSQDGKIWIPFILDLHRKELIYVDLYSKGERNIELNKHFPKVAEAISKYVKSKPNFYYLAECYAKANDIKMVSKDEAEFKIGLSDDCDVNILKLYGEEVINLQKNS